LQVEVVGRIEGNLEQAARDACTAARTAGVGARVEAGPFVLVCSHVGSPPAPHGALHVWQGKVRVGAVPTGITEDCTYLLVTSPRMERALLRAVGSLINEANRQLPSRRTGVVFIDGPSEFGRLAASVRLLLPEYGHCLAVGMVTPTQLTFSHRTLDEPIVRWIFMGQIPPLFYRLRQVVLRRSRLHRLLLGALSARW
jgi:hypothetical protein